MSLGASGAGRPKLHRPVGRARSFTLWEEPWYETRVSVRDVLLWVIFRGASRSALTTATNSLRLGVVEFTGVDEAIAALESEQWKAILVDTTLSGASRFCAEARAVRGLFDVPLIALSPRLTDLAFLNALRWGADDVVALGAAEPLAVRLASLFANPASTGTKARGTAVVADPDRRRGDGLGRALHLAGYSVKYANDPVSARYYLAKSDTNLYVLNSELADPTTLLGTGEHNADCRTVVLAKPTQLADLEQQFRGNRNVVVMSSGAPRERIVRSQLALPERGQQTWRNTRVVRHGRLLQSGGRLP